MSEIQFTKKLLRSYTFFAAVSIAIYTPVIYYLGIYEVAYLAALLVVLMIVSYLLTFYNQFNLSRIIFFASIAGVIVASIISKKYLNGVSFYIFPLMAYTFVLTFSHEKEFRRLVSLIVFVAFLLIIVFLSFKENILFTLEYKIFYLLNFVLAFLLLSYLLGIISYKNIRREKALQENQANIQTIIDTIPQLVIQVDREYRIKSLNNRFAAIVKSLFDKKIAEGESILEFTFDTDTERVKKAIDLAFNGQQTIVEKRIKLKNHNDLWIQLHYLPVTVQNTITSVLLIVSDQTEYKKLLINANKLADIVAESPIPIFEINTNGLILYANSECANEFGLNTGNYVPSNWMDFIITVFDDEASETEIKFKNKFYRFIAKKDKAGETLRMYALDITLIKENNSLLEQQKLFYESLLDVIPSDVVVLDSDLKYRFVNKYAIKDDSRRKWIIGKSDKEYFELRNFPQELYEQRREKLMKSIETGREIEWTEEFTINGEKKYFLRKVKPFYEEGKNSLLLLGYGTEITSQKIAENEIEKQKKLYREILNNLPISVFLKNLEGKYLFGNTHTLKYIGISEDQFVGKIDYDIYPSNLASEYRKTDIVAIEQGEHTFEEKLNTPWGIEYIYGGKKLIRLDEKESLILGFSIDVTDKIKSQLEPKKQTELIEKILDISPTLIYIKRADGSIYMANKATAKMFGYDSPDVIINKTPEDLHVKKEELAIWKLHDLKVLESNELHIFEETFTTPDNRVLWYLTHKIPFNIDENEKCILGVGVDITPLKNIQADLLELNRKAREAADAKMMFLSNMSHEIRTPLNAIIGFGQLLMQEELDDKVREFAKTILFAAKNLLSLINDILDYSKIQEGKFPVNFVSFNLNKFISNIESIFKLKAREKNIYFKIEKEFDENIIIQSDSTILNQILNNLISNAIKFTKIGGVKVIISVKDKNLNIEVHDTGIGISEDFKNKIFNTFEQENSQISREFGGTGLGLAITKKFVELLSGEIYFESTQGVGTIFYVKIPVNVIKFNAEDQRKNSIEEERNQILEYSENHKNYTILIVEDNIVNQRLLVNILERLGFNYDVANNGSEAVIKVNLKKYDLILMDLHTPEVDGFRATELIRLSSGNATSSNVPIIAVTADVLPETLERCEAIGFNSFLKKPMEFYQLYAILKKLVEGNFS
ncbi:hypothetical protein JCM31826_10680 [Thermaurantimonas aggregans]|uniref:histidine kinase n=1 Tax=Thermaurantimonas aggregans TaxID=2173829 RepID=A0A401XKN2_9FLAO|nr:PAS domain-containing protein [Thermaurantimonas aggregans]GCD77586.1 hypothetical protein JCM31826_10680 [Thermaurantimonas aggregans]